MGVTAIGFDADDTLWQNEQFYRLTERRLTELLAEHAEPGDISRRLLEAEKRNLAFYGFGIKGFTLSMIETAIEVTEGRAPAAVIQDWSGCADRKNASDANEPWLSSTSVNQSSHSAHRSRRFSSRPTVQASSIR